MPTYLKKRGARFHFQKRVPEEFRERIARDFIQLSLKTDKENVAAQRAQSLNLLLDEFWDELAIPDVTQDDDMALEKTLKTAVQSRFQYSSTKDLIARSSLAEALTRINLAYGADSGVEKILKVPDVSRDHLFSKARDDFLSFEEGNLRGYSDDQIRKWKNPRLKASKNFIHRIGDKSVPDISRQDILDFRLWWLDRIKNDDLTANSANKEFTIIKKILKHANNNHAFDLPINDFFAEIRLKESEKNIRHPFSDDFIQNTLLRLDDTGLNAEARLLIFAMADTGARIGELVGLDKDDIFLDHDVPHIKIRPNAIRALKTPQSERDIPLVGASLFAFQSLQGPFKRYQGKATLVSSTINKYFRENNILPSPNHSLYSLRHSFDDRLTAAEIPEKIQAVLMGHKYVRPRYGHGPSLEQKRSWLKRIAFRVE